MDLNKYIPINTNEKVDAIIDELLQRKPPISIEFDILKRINKFKTQLYFKERFSEIKPLISKKVVNNQSIIKQLRSNEIEYSKTEFKLAALLSNLPIYEISNLIGIPSNTLIRIIKQRNKDCPLFDKQSLLNDKYISSCMEFFLSTYEAKQNKDKLEKLQQEFPNRRLLEEKFKPSFGKEGNYRKLIYYGPKT